MPTYDYGGEFLCAFAPQKNYRGLYLDPALIGKSRPGLPGLDLGKSCIRFRRLEQLLSDIVAQISREVASGRSPG